MSHYPQGRVLTLDLVARLGDRNLEILKDSLRKGFELFRTKGGVGETQTSTRRYRQVGDDDFETDSESESPTDNPTPKSDGSNVD